TKNASSAVVPKSAPSRQTLVKNAVMFRLTLPQRIGELGSNTTHCVPSSIVSSIKRKRRRTLMYLHSGSRDSVRAPQITAPLPGMDRMTFTPTGFKVSCSPLVTNRSTSAAEFSDPSSIPARALWTPRTTSVCEYVPTIAPDGGTNLVFPVEERGSAMAIQGQ